MIPRWSNKMWFFALKLAKQNNAFIIILLLNNGTLWDLMSMHVVAGSIPVLGKMFVRTANVCSGYSGYYLFYKKISMYICDAHMYGM